MPPERTARDNRQVLRLVQLRPAVVLPFLAQVADAFAEAARADLRLAFAEDGTAQVFLPHWNERPHRPQAEVMALADRMVDAATAVSGRAPPRPGDPCSVNLASLAEIGAATMIALRLATQPARPDAAPDAEPNHRRVAAVTADAETVARISSEVLRRGRHATVAAASGLPTGGEAVLIALQDDAAQGSTLSGLRALLSGNGQLTLLHRIDTPGGTLFLPEDETLPPETLVDAGKVLRGLRSLGRLGPDEALALFCEGRGRMRALRVAQPSATPPAAEEVALAISDPGLRLDILEPLPVAEATRALQERIVARQFPVGYRVRLAPLPVAHADDADIEALRTRIAEIEERIEYLQTFAAPQLRLLRFSEAQLPALVDGLRRMPPGMIHDNRLRFATAHAAGRAGPAHFLLYDPAALVMDGMLPEHFWRGATEDRPIAYALDPFAAAALQEAPDSPLVFVPHGQQLLPSIRKFGGDLAGNLRLVLGNLFASAEAVLAQRGARPAFVFSPSDDPDFELAVELIDESRFAPLHLQIKWINDHMRLLSPRSGDPAHVAALAEALYEGEQAEAIRVEVVEVIAALDAAWQEGAAALTERLLGLESRLADEVEAVAQRARLAIGLLEAGAARVEALDAAVARMRDVLAAADAGAARLTALPATIEANWIAAIEAYEAALAASDQMLAEADARLRKRGETLTRVRSEWERAWR